jgi:hypothetical protein
MRSTKTIFFPSLSYYQEMDVTATAFAVFFGIVSAAAGVAGWLGYKKYQHLLSEHLALRQSFKEMHGNIFKQNFLQKM